jgi:5-methylcytosine-specific restriction enzyme A
MPWSLKRPCRERGCNELVDGGGYCRKHQQERSRERGSAHAQGYGRRWQRMRIMVLNREPLCRICLAPATDVDHILPRKRGGLDSFENLQALCHSCHSQKTAREHAWG